MNTPRLSKLALMALVLTTLLAALWGGLIRIGWLWSAPTPAWVGAHGPMLVCGVLGTLISLERAIALQKTWAFGAPLLSGVGALFLLLGGSGWPGPVLMMAASLTLVGVFVAAGHRTLYMMTMALGAVAWAFGNTLWLMGLPLSQVTLWWMGFLIFTIAGERLELSRILRLTRWPKTLFGAAVGLCLAGLMLSVGVFDAGVRLLGVGLIGLTLWLGRYDIARRTIRQTGLTRFIAAALLAGYVWLGVAGLLAVIHGGVTVGPRYDALLHAVFVGFVFSMIFGHAPIIFPAILRVPQTFDKTYYLPLALLHLSLLLRVAADVSGWFDGRRWGGLLNGLALLIYFANVVRVSAGSRPRPGRS